MEKMIEWEEGNIVINNKSQLLITADYPYYRDKKENWLDRLKKIKNVGVDIITFYIPWRHHAMHSNGNTRFTFSHRFRENADLNTFLSFIKNLGMFCIVKPGPFIHGEVQLGGLPDYTSASFNRSIVSMKELSQKSITSQGLDLPSPFCSQFKKYYFKWIKEVSEKIIKPYQYPKGPIIGIQIGNEGIYSDVSMPFLYFDYSIAALRNYQNYLRKKYKNLSHYNQTHNSQFKAYEEVRFPSLENLTSNDLYLKDWIEWVPKSLNQFYQEIDQLLPKSIIKLTNISPPLHSLKFKGKKYSQYDVWLIKVKPDQWKNIKYGFTSWTGNVMMDKEALHAYIFSAKFRRGPNLEENWGHLWTDKKYQHAITNIYHAALAIAAGASGINIYTICATQYWDKCLDLDKNYLKQTLTNASIFDPPYCPAAPINERGELTQKYEALRIFLKFINQEKVQLSQCRTKKEVAILYSVSWAEKYVFSGQNKNIKPLIPVTKSIIAMQSYCLQQGLNFDAFNMDEIKPSQLKSYPIIMMCGDINLLKNKFADHLYSLAHRIIKPKFIKSKNKTIRPITFQLCSQDKSVVYVFVFSQSDKNIKFKLNIFNRYLYLSINPYGIMIFKFSNKKLVAGYVKVVNEFSKNNKLIKIKFGNQKIGLNRSSDFCFFTKQHRKVYYQ